MSNLKDETSYMSPSSSLPAFTIHQNGVFGGRTALLYEPFVSQLNSLLKQRVHGHNPLDAVAIHVHLKAIRSN